MYKGITFCSESHDYFPLHSMPLYLLCKLFFYLSFYLLYFLFILAIHLSPYASFYLPQQFFSFVVSKLCVRNMQALLENHFVWNLKAKPGFHSRPSTLFSLSFSFSNTHRNYVSHSISLSLSLFLLVTRLN